MTDETPSPEAEPDSPASAGQTDVAPETSGDESSAAETGQPELEIGSTATMAAAPKVASVIRGKVTEQGVALGTGRRKTAVARVRVQDGDGKLTINGRQIDDYFKLERDRSMVQAPLKATEMAGKVDVWVRVKGGGLTGQTGAVVLGIARALQAKDPDLHHTLSVGGYLTRDGRMVERKKYGYKKARKSFQFSKR
jgi:small subunit ribosomal protein S9